MKNKLVKFVLSTLAIIPVSSTILLQVDEEINKQQLNKSTYNSEKINCDDVIVEHKDIDINPDNSNILGREKFNSDNDMEKYESVWNISEVGFGEGQTFEYKINLKEKLNLNNDSWIDEVKFNKNERFDFYRTIQLTDHDTFSDEDEYESGRFWSSYGIDNEDTNSNIDKIKSYTYTGWNEMDENQKRYQAPYVGDLVYGDEDQNNDYISIKMGETKELVDLRRDPENEGHPLEYYNKSDNGSNDGFINETSLRILASLDMNNNLTIKIIFGDGKSEGIKEFESYISKISAIHLPKIDVIEKSNSLPEGITSNTNNIVHEKKSKEIWGPSVHLDYEPDNVEFSNDAKRTTTVTSTYMNDSGYGTYQVVNHYYAYPIAENSKYNSETGDYSIAFGVSSKTKEYPKNTKDILINQTTTVSYEGEIIYDRDYIYPGGIYDFSNAINENYTKETFILDTRNALINYENENLDYEKNGVYSGIYTSSATYDFVEEIIKENAQYQNIPLENEYSDIVFYDENGNEIIDETKHLSNGMIDMKIKSTEFSDCIKGETDLIEFYVPFIDDFNIYLNEGKSKSGYESYYELDFDNHNINLYTNKDLTIEFYSKDNSFVNVDGVYTTNENNYKTFSTNLDTYDDPWGRENETITQNFTSQGIEYKLKIKNNSSSVFREETLIENINFIDENGYEIRNITNEIYVDESNIKRDVMVAENENVKISSINIEKIKEQNRFIKDVGIYGDGDKLIIIDQNDNFYEYKLISSEEFDNSGGSYLKTNEGKNQINAAYERGLLNQTYDADTLTEEFDSVTINKNYSSFTEETNIGDLVKEPLFIYYIENEMEDYSNEFGLSSGTTVEKYQRILDFAIYEGLMPFAKNEQGEIINPYEWNAKVIKINGQDVINPSSTIINDKDIISIQIKHNRTIDENPIFYGEGVVDIKAKLI